MEQNLSFCCQTPEHVWNSYSAAHKQYILVPKLLRCADKFLFYNCNSSDKNINHACAQSRLSQTGSHTAKRHNASGQFSKYNPVTSLSPFDHNLSLSRIVTPQYKLMLLCTKSEEHSYVLYLIHSMYMISHLLIGCSTHVIRDIHVYGILWFDFTLWPSKSLKKIKHK